jgi:hypothetical protein
MAGKAYLMGGVVQDDPGLEQYHSRHTYSIDFNKTTIIQAVFPSSHGLNKYSLFFLFSLVVYF